MPLASELLIVYSADVPPLAYVLLTCFSLAEDSRLDFTMV